MPTHALLAHAPHRVPCLAEERTITGPGDVKLRDSRDHNANPILWMSPPLVSTTVGKLESWKLGWPQLFNSPTLQLSDSAVSVLPRMCGSPARPPPAAPAAPQQPCAPPPRWPSARRP